MGDIYIFGICIWLMVLFAIKHKAFPTNSGSSSDVSPFMWWLFAGVVWPISIFPAIGLLIGKKFIK